MKTPIILSILIVFSCFSFAEEDIDVTHSTADLKSVTGEETWQGLWDKYFTKNELNQTNTYQQSEHLYRIVVSHDNSFVFFTKNTHPAHPSFAKIYIGPVEGKLKIRTLGFTWGDDPSYQQFIREEILPFSNELAQRVREDLIEK